MVMRTFSNRSIPSCAEEAFLTTGTPVFNNPLVIARKRLLEKKYESKKPLRGTFTYEYKQEQIVDKSIKFMEDENGPFILYESVDKQTPYVIGGDTAGEGSDSFVGQVLNNITGKQVAVWRGQIDSDLYAKQMYCMGKFFNYALIAIETNFDLHAVIELQRLGYYRQFRRELIDQITDERKEVFGFVTTKVTRPVVIDELITISRESIELINDIETLNEMLTFIRNDKGRAEAMQGKHDDCVLSLAIAYNARSQQSMTMMVEYTEETYSAGFGRTGY